MTEPVPSKSTMGFAEAMARAKAAHAKVRSCQQPGNSYRTEFVCRCGAFVFASDWGAHVLDAADRLIEEAQ